MMYDGPEMSIRESSNGIAVNEIELLLTLKQWYEILVMTQIKEVWNFIIY